MADTKYDRSAEGTVSLEETMVRHFFYGLDRLQTCWVNDTGFNKEKFNLQLLYLIRLLPNKTKQAEIMTAWNSSLEEFEKLMPALSPSERQSYAGMEVVTEIVMFVCQAFDLINEDILGPATSKQYQDAVIELPDMPEKEDEPSIA
jgi:hypothetical protein